MQKKHVLPISIVETLNAQIHDKDGNTRMSQEVSKWLVSGL